MLSQSDGGGGAAVAARRLQEGLRRLDIDARMVVRQSLGAGEEVGRTPRWAGGVIERVRFALDKLPLLRYPDRDETPFSTAWLPDGLRIRIQTLHPDVINIHWVGHGYVHPFTIGKLRQPIVWTLHDVWPFTGGCHVNLGCTRYQDRCGACPRLGSPDEEDLSRSGWQRKHDAWRRQDLTAVAPSRWMANCAAKSTLFRDRRIEIIPNGLDTQRFRPTDRSQARAALGLPHDKSLVLFAVAAARRVVHKGFDLLESTVEALYSHSYWHSRLELVLAGPSETAGAIQSRFPASAVGSLNDEKSMAALYGAVDVTVVPSRQENLPQVAVESIACGTPVAAFDTAGMPDVVDHQVNGYLSRPFDPKDLARGIHWILEDSDRYRYLSDAARAKALRQFDIDRQAEQYRELFSDVLEEGGRNPT